MSEIRDTNGNLAAYTLEGDVKTAFEVLAVRQQAFETRTDSNLSDIKDAQAVQASDIKKLFAKISEMLEALHQTLERVSALTKENIALSTVCAEYTNAKLAREANWKMIYAVGKWVGGIIATIGTAFGIYAVIKK